MASMIIVRLLTPNDENRYAAFLAKSSEFPPTVSRRYEKVLARFLPDTTEVTFLALDENGEIIGALPCRRMENERYGPILNSLPFFGSVGGVQLLEKKPHVYQGLFNAMNEYCIENSIVSATIIGSPFDKQAFFHAELPGPVLTDERIAMISTLPENGEDLEGRLFSQYHDSRRRNVRKAIRTGINVTEKNHREALAFLERIHVENISSIGGLIKPHGFFRAVEDVMEPGEDFRVYEASLKGEPVASLLLIYFGKIVEYFVPALLHEHRPTQALCLLIHRAMLDAAEEGYRYWNWGGTLKTQTSLYTFKKKWGVQESSYHYYTKIYPGSEALLALEPAKVLTEYPYFYVFPFGSVPNETS